MKQSFVQALHFILKDETTAKFVEIDLARHYAATVTRGDAHTLVEGYETGAIDASVRVMELADFAAQRLPDLVREQWRAFKVPSQAMIPTLLPDDHFMIKTTAYQTVNPQRGDIIAFRYPEDEKKIFVKRVVGLPHERIEIRDKDVYVNGTRLTEPYVQHTDRSILAENPRDNLGPVTVPPDAYFVMGDNRESSLDSRFWGYVHKDKVLGKAMFIYWSVDNGTKIPRWDRLNSSLYQAPNVRDLAGRK